MQPRSPIIPGLEHHEIKIAEDQEEYQTLPALKLTDGTLITRWRLTWRERLAVLLEGNVYLSVWTFGQPLQPLYLEASEPKVTITEHHSDQIPLDWKDDLTSPTAHVEAMTELDEMQTTEEVHRG